MYKHGTIPNPTWAWNAKNQKKKKRKEKKTWEITIKDYK